MLSNQATLKKYHGYILHSQNHLPKHLYTVLFISKLAYFLVNTIIKISLISVYIAISVKVLHLNPNCSFANIVFKNKWLHSLLYIHGNNVHNYQVSQVWATHGTAEFTCYWHGACSKESKCSGATGHVNWEDSNWVLCTFPTAELFWTQWDHRMNCKAPVCMK